MKFFRVDNGPSDNKRAQSACYLVNDNWDDFSFKTMFGAVLFDDEGIRHDLGSVRILKRDLKRGRVPLPTEFDWLDENWCSLGAQREYYLALSKINQST